MSSSPEVFFALDILNDSGPLRGRKGLKFWSYCVVHEKKELVLNWGSVTQSFRLRWPANGEDRVYL